jgi:ubiquinone/menaquinone biosynthesis C-methylase UbiE
MGGLKDDIMTKWHIKQYERKFEEVVQPALQTGEPVLDVGRGQKFGEDQLEEYQITPPDNIEYLTIDVRAEPEPDFVADLSQLPVKDSQLSVVFVESVLEHVAPVSNLMDCMDQIYRGLIDSGVVVGWVPFCYHFHGGSFPDGNRFTYDGVDRLLNEFSEVWIQSCGGPISVFLDSLFKYGYLLRTKGIEKYETILRYLLFRDFLSDYGHIHKKAINSVGFRFFARK